MLLFLVRFPHWTNGNYCIFDLAELLGPRHLNQPHAISISTSLLNHDLLTPTTTVGQNMSMIKGTTFCYGRANFGFTTLNLMINNRFEIWRRLTQNKRVAHETVDNNVLIRSGEAPAIGWSRNMLYSGFNTLHRSVIRRQTGFAARITRTLSSYRK